MTSTVIELDDSIHTVRVRGEVDLATAAELRDCIERARCVTDRLRIVIDLEAVTFIDSTGLCELLRPVTEGCSVTLRQPSEQVRRVLEVAGLGDAFGLAEA